MALVKLDSGDYINTEYVTAIYTVTQPWDGKTCSLEMVNATDGAMLYITDADRDRIAEAMGGDYESRQRATAKIAKDIMDDDPDYDELKAGLS